MKKRYALLFFLVWTPLNAQLTATRNDKTMRIEIDGKLFTEFRSDQRLACMFPIIAKDGSHLTRRYPFDKGIEGEPTDHPHHVSFWLAHGNVSGHDFWHDANTSVKVKSLGEPVSEKPNKVGFSAELEWIGKNGVRLLSETRTYTISSGGDTRTIDVSYKLQATEGDVVFGNTKEGAFAIRVAPTMQVRGEKASAGKITNSKGLTNDDAWGKRAEWVASHGPNVLGNQSVLAFMDHPKNLNHPTWWHARDYGLIAANPFGATSYKDKDPAQSKGYKLKKGETLTQTYRLVIHAGDIDSANLKERWEDFSKPE